MIWTKSRLFGLLFCVHKKPLVIITQTLYDKAFMFSDLIMNVESSAVIVEVLVEKPIHHYADLLPPIFLVGPMGAGKTTIGKLLAKHLKRPFLDVDCYISKKAGADIPWIFAKEGELGFRERESRAMNELSALSDIVLATGGGVVERECISKTWIGYFFGCERGHPNPSHQKRQESPFVAK